MRIAYVFKSALCWLSALRIVVSKKVEVKEVVFDSAVTNIHWFGPEQRIVIVQTNRGRLYRSTNKGDKWNEITDQLRVEDGPQMVVDNIITSSADVNTVLAAGVKGSHFISTDAGETWRLIKHKAGKATIHTFVFHKTRPKWAMLSTWTEACKGTKATPKRKTDDDDDSSAADSSEPCNHMLYLTKDLGKTFTLVSSYVVQFSWGDVSHKQQDRIYFTHFRQRKGDQPKLYMWSKDVDFAYTDNGGRNVQRLVYKGNKFMVSHSFIFVAKLKDHTSQTVSLMASSDGAATFRQGKLPQDLEERSYTVLDTSEGAVMLHVNHGSKEPPYNVGNVYISDSEGVRYTLSLPNNVRGSSGDCEFDRVLSLEGVYLANFKDTGKGDSDVGKAAGTSKSEKSKEAEDLEESATGTEVDKRHTAKAKSKDESVVRTVISFDKGGQWSYLKAPKVDSLGKKIDCPPERCWLHMHGITNFHTYAPFYSTENAVGIIMGTGNVGPYLRFEPDQTNTYLSRDGGLTWVEAHKGAFIYEFGDHGGLIVMADDIRKTKQVVFSWNEGQSWYDFELSQDPVEVDNIVTEPNATSTQFLLYGTRGDAGVLYHLDFEALGQPLCKGVWASDSVSSDYETWMPSNGVGSDKCMLGKQVTYTRRKQTSECFNGEKFERPVVKKNCACTEEDYECDMGFARKVNSMECKSTDDGSIPVPSQCTSSDFYYVKAHRKVIGDTCEGGYEPAKVALPCPASSKLSNGAMSVLGTFSTVIVIFAAVTYLSRSEKFKGYFANVGYDNFANVRYATIGAKAPETGLDSCGTQFDSDFMESEQDHFGGGAPQLMAYNDAGGGATSMRKETVRRIDTAAAQVPKLLKPPGAAGGGGGEEDDPMDLL